MRKYDIFKSGKLHDIYENTSYSDLDNFHKIIKELNIPESNHICFLFSKNKNRLNSISFFVSNEEIGQAPNFDYHIIGKICIGEIETYTYDLDLRENIKGTIEELLDRYKCNREIEQIIFYSYENIIESLKTKFKIRN
jgi:hypothetical protein